MSFTPLLGYPTKVANKNFETIDWVGPVLYTVGGQPFTAASFNWGAFDSAFGSVSQAGTYQVVPRFTGSGARQTVYLMIFVIATGVEAAAIDLSAQKFRLSFMGV